MLVNPQSAENYPLQLLLDGKSAPADAYGLLSVPAQIGLMVNFRLTGHSMAEFPLA